MAEITQPSPVKPVWPVRREEHSERRQPAPTPDARQQRRERGQESEGELEQPMVDEYA